MNINLKKKGGVNIKWNKEGGVNINLKKMGGVNIKWNRGGGGWI